MRARFSCHNWPDPQPTSRIRASAGRASRSKSRALHDALRLCLSLHCELAGRGQNACCRVGDFGRSAVDILDDAPQFLDHVVEGVRHGAEGASGDFRLHGEVALCDVHGSTDLVIFHTANRDMADEICRTISDATGLWYKPVM